MRRFNPDKELKKIQHGNRNKIAFGIIALLLIIAIGSTYALYQIRYSKRVIYTKVAPFYNKDIIISVKLDDQEKSTDKFPTKEEGYVYSHIECEKDNITNVNWDKENWKLNADINGPDKCTVFFAKSPFNMKSCEGKEMSECLLEEGPKFENILAFDDPDQNARYYGKDPANYIWFNCDDYTAPSEKTCERWRIIGSFKNIEKVNEDGTTTNQNLIKIIRNESIGKYAWDNKYNENVTTNNYGAGINDWTDARLMKLLNPGYEDEPIGGSLYYNGIGNKETKCYYGWTIDETKSCDFSEIGLQNDITRNMIETVNWNLGMYISGSSTLSDQMYTYERGTGTCKETGTCEDIRKVKWSFKIGLMYASDYGFATGGGEIGRQTCLEKALLNWNQDQYVTNCINNDWLYIEGTDNQWLLTSSTLTDYIVLHIWPAGHLGNWNWAHFDKSIIRPALYLTHDTKVLSGDGTYDKPYVINTN